MTNRKDKDARVQRAKNKSLQQYNDMKDFVDTYSKVSSLSAKDVRVLFGDADLVSPIVPIRKGRFYY